MEKITVAVIGAGASGLATLKNLREEGFDATAFDKRGSIGGLWQYNESPSITTVLETTRSNKSHWSNCFSDFPFPSYVPPFASGTQMYDYLKSYSEHFDLRRHIKLDTDVTSITRNAQDTKWILSLRVNGQLNEMVEFDKVAICTGAWTHPKMPQIEGKEKFEGRIIHSREYKRPADFKGLKVMVLGCGNTAADTSTSLVSHADKIYLSHRRGANLLPRMHKGKPIDLDITRRIVQFKYALEAISPAFASLFFNSFIQHLTTSIFKLDPTWRMHPPPSIITHQPTISDNLVDQLTNGSIISVKSISRFTAANEVELDDGMRLEVDIVICCTGYASELNLISDLHLIDDVTEDAGIVLPRLYQNIFPSKRADSVAYLNNVTFPTGYFPLVDLSSMAVAQVWKNASPLPSPMEMEKAIDGHHEWMKSLPKQDTLYTDLVQEKSWVKWVHDTAGTGVNENLGYGISGWWFFLTDFRFCNLLMGGVNTPIVNRLFAGKRKMWDGARQAILAENKAAAAL